VIRAYVRGRQLLEEEATLADSLAPTGDADKDKRAKKRPVKPSIVVLIFHAHLLARQARGRNCPDEEEPGATFASEECKDRQGRRDSHAAQPTSETGYNSKTSNPVISSLTHFVIRDVAGIAGKWVT